MLKHTTFIAAVSLAAIAATITLPVNGIGDRLGTLAVLVLLAAFSGTRSVIMPRLGIRVTPSDAFMFCALAVLGPLAGPIVALAGTVGALFGTSKPTAASRVVFNLATITLSAAAGSWAYTGMQASGIPGSGAPLAGMFAATAAFFLVNTLLVAIAIFMAKGGSFLATWHRSGLWTFGASLTSMLLGLGLMAALTPLGPAGLVLGLAGTAAVSAAYRQHGEFLSA